MRRSKLQVKRILAGISQVEVAHRLGKSGTWLSLVERGYLVPSPDMLARIETIVQETEEPISHREFRL